MATLSRALCWKELLVSGHLLKSILLHLHCCLTKGKKPAVRSQAQYLGCSCSFLKCLSRPPCVLCQLEQNSAAMETANTRQSWPLHLAAQPEIMAFVVIYWMLMAMLSRLYPQALARDTLTLHHQGSLVNFPSLLSDAGLR